VVTQGSETTPQERNRQLRNDPAVDSRTGKKGNATSPIETWRFEVRKRETTIQRERRCGLGKDELGRPAAPVGSPRTSNAKRRAKHYKKQGKGRLSIKSIYTRKRSRCREKPVRGKSAIFDRPLRDE